jgi:hypothetical protein
MAARLLLSGLLSVTGTTFAFAFLGFLACILLGTALFLARVRPLIRKGIEARGGTLESVRFGLNRYHVTYRTKGGERRVVSCVANCFGAFFGDDDRPASSADGL